jgi:hypothetical protein
VGGVELCILSLPSEATNYILLVSHCFYCSKYCLELVLNFDQAG